MLLIKLNPTGTLKDHQVAILKAKLSHPSEVSVVSIQVMDDMLYIDYDYQDSEDDT